MNDAISDQRHGLPLLPYFFQNVVEAQRSWKEALGDVFLPSIRACEWGFSAEVIHRTSTCVKALDK